MKKQKQKSQRSAASKFYSSLSSHQLKHGKLSPPFNRMEKMRPSSWRDDHLPLMLWAVLLAEVFPRNDFLGCLRTILHTCARWFSEGGPLAPADLPPPANGNINFTSILDMQTLAQIPNDLFDEFVKIPLRHPLGYEALRPILLLESIPAVERWRAYLKTASQEDDWETMVRAIASTLDHQSQRSTDIRWFKMMTPIMAGKMHFPESMAERVREFSEYPNRGDQRSVRPSIRANEMMLRRTPVPLWVAAFWGECATRTDCIDPTDFDGERRGSTSLPPEAVFRTRHSVVTRFFQNQSSTEVDARLDSSFGLVLYALSIVQEISISNMHEEILGRLALRTLVESVITLSYLAHKDDKAAWSTWRVYGAGQAKLAFLRTQGMVGDVPKFFEEEELEQIANEDQWQEFLDIDIGHWDRTNLRTMARDSNCMQLYESFYSWTSSFNHAHWGSVRDTNFITCHNPLHRLHRIPRLVPRKAKSIESDAANLVNGMLGVLERLFPEGDPLQRLALAASMDSSDPTSP